MEIIQKSGTLAQYEEANEALSAKRSYASPTIKVVEFIVEGGIFTSNTDSVEGSLKFQLTSPTTATQTTGNSSWSYDNDWFTRSTQTNN